METGPGSLDDLEKSGLNAREKTKSSYAATQKSDVQPHTDSGGQLVVASLRLYM